MGPPLCGLGSNSLNDAPAKDAAPPEATVSTSRAVLSLSQQVWRSRLAWRIAITVFITILAVQGAVMPFMVHIYEQEQLDALAHEAQSSMMIALGQSRDQLTPPLDEEQTSHIISSTIVDGIAVYALDYSLLQKNGDHTVLRPVRSPEASRTYRGPDGTTYEVLFNPDDLQRPYYIAAKLDATRIQPMVVNNVKTTILILMLRASLVTLVLMIAIGAWLLRPMIMLRNNLLSAAKHPEQPVIQRPRRETRDEVGLTMRIANDLIRQNAANLKRLRAQAEDRIHKLAYFDALTNLPNRTYFLEKLDEQMRQTAGAEARRIAVLAIDIDHFKDINDTMGHDVGDRLLEAIGRRLVKALPPDAVIARASADEFMAMITLPSLAASSEPVVESILAAMAEPVSILQERFQVRVSVGCAHYPDDGIDARQLVKNADIALNRAKEEGRDTVRYYSQDFDRVVQQRFQLLRDLRTALDENQLQLHFHPQFNLKTGQLIGAEALLRWWKPDNSREGGVFIPPAEFIPVAEQSGLIVPIGEWVLKTACAANKQWQKQGFPPFRMAINISGVQFHRADIVAQVESALAETGLDPRWLELEVTESVFMENVDTAIETLDRLHKLGCELAVDDFGTGYSSLSYLRQFPIDRLKIDQSFVRNALVNPGDRMIARTIINLGHSLGLRVIAEGVETSDHEEFLREEGCDEVQGFKYGKPMSAADFTEYAQNHFRGNKGRLSVVDGGV